MYVIFIQACLGSIEGIYWALKSLFPYKSVSSAWRDLSFYSALLWTHVNSLDNNATLKQNGIIRCDASNRWRLDQEGSKNTGKRGNQIHIIK